VATLFQAIRGMNDILPNQMPYWHKIETAIRRSTAVYGYHEIRFPIVEKTDLFKRAVGEVTDVVEKEMYTFEDRNGDSLSLRPEGTACCVRSGIEHGLLHNQIQRLWYMGPMFRHERPQKGRYRQFQQLGVEAFGMAGAEIEFELILMTVRLWKALGVSQYLTLELNSLGSPECRAQYRQALVTYFERDIDRLDEDSRRRLSTNPLRILDSKNPDMVELIHNAPKLNDYLDESSNRQFQDLLKLLDEQGIAYRLNSKLVRGLDYYNGLVFEWITTELGAQGTVCAGGRYDGLAQQLGAKLATPAVGFAIGIERLIILMELSPIVEAAAGVYIIPASESHVSRAFLLAESLREHNMTAVVDCASYSEKSQRKRAANSGAKVCIIAGDTYELYGLQEVDLKQNFTTLDEVLVFFRKI
jgi:histidyl-tRNA synthetase